MRLLEAMSWLVVVRFEYQMAQPTVVLHRRHFSCLLQPRVLDWGASSSYVIHWVCSTYAGDSCDSDVPFCGNCNTQLRIGLSSFLPLVLFACILLKGYTLCEAWLQGLFLRFPLRVPSFVLPMYPSRLGRLAFVWASILLGEGWLRLRDVPLVVPSYECSLVDG